MFLATFRSTVKSVLRSVTFWLLLAMFLIILVRYGIQQVQVYWESAESMQQYVPDYELPEHISFESYISEVDNLVHAGSLIYPLALLAIIATVLVLNRDYGDQFFEIEKAAGIKPSVYLLGRLSAITAIVFLVQWVASFAILQICVFGKGGVDGMSFLSYLGDALFRLTRTNLCAALPYILFYVGITYFLGTLFRNGIAAASGGFLYAIAVFVVNLLYRHEQALEFYTEYLSPMPNKLRHFVTYWGLENEEQMFARFRTSLGKASLCIAFLAGVGAVCSLLSYLLIRKRES